MLLQEKFHVLKIPAAYYQRIEQWNKNAGMDAVSSYPYIKGGFREEKLTIKLAGYNKNGATVYNFKCNYLCIAVIPKL